MYRTDPRDDAERLCQVLDGIAFPAAKWQLVMQAEDYGADAVTSAELWAVPVAVYPDLRSVLDAVAANHGPDRGAHERAAPDHVTLPRHAHRLRPPFGRAVPGRVRPLR